MGDLARESLTPTNEPMQLGMKRRSAWVSRNTLPTH